eukprot:CAMPEP_0178905864 /NCGR_PEP_ID=MMETSP0786-20121207/6512_1 /TAXON_ID=186022 /ORGANISM="Thalassionema frauenfeldii, Strain CCMP 1798" /LENGTH=330 /DNA_ID=CAMNT_0020577519 /DNA_START=214 /DNA_END=1206 /DNA_ORIENTATION=+
MFISKSNSKSKHEEQSSLLHNDSSDGRRVFFKRGILSISTIITSNIVSLPCLAVGDQEDDLSSGEKKKSKPNNRPSAPIEALLPATRCKLWIDDAYNIATKISDKNKEQQQQQQNRILLTELNQVLVNRPTLFRKTEKALLQKITATAATAQLTTGVSTADKQQYQMNRLKLFNPAEKISAALNQADVERQWGILQYAESKREQDNEIRAAFNFYTRQLAFGESYVLTASKEDKKRMIRNDELPTLTDVIRSDLDLRDLYRNQLLTDLEDLQAEVAYQLSRKEPNETIETEDVFDLMNKVYNSCSKWFGLIDSNEVAQAVSMLKSEDLID